MSKRTEFVQVLVEMWRTFERQQTSKVFAHERIVAKATGLVEFESSETEKVKREQCGKSVQRRCDGY